MKNQNDQKIEDFLSSFSRKPAPPALKGKILHKAQRERAETRIMTSGLWKVVLCCTTCILLFLLLDTIISYHQKKIIASLVGIQPITQVQKQNDFVLRLVRLLYMSPETENMAWLKGRLLRKHKSDRNSRVDEFLRLKEELNGNKI